MLVGLLDCFGIVQDNDETPKGSKAEHLTVPEPDSLQDLVALQTKQPLNQEMVILLNIFKFMLMNVIFLQTWLQTIVIIIVY